MVLTYFKRYRMEIDLGQPVSPPPVPPGYRFLGFSKPLLDAFAEAKYYSFRDELDTNLFPCLGELVGCRRLMSEIAAKPGFLPEATWLLVHQPDGLSTPEYCGTIQGIRDRSGLGAIQNVGVTPAHRGRGLGTNLVLKSLEGFRQAGLHRAHLEVTAGNTGAIRLYRRLGFVTVKTVFKACEVPA
jgi:RimJ/RimL family protein N-acetyltransferase